jgi:peptide-methionine (S)-S-oxide reductase
MLLLSLAMWSCERPTHAAADLPRPAEDLPVAETSEPRTAVFAAGCFWCVEAVFEMLDGVSDVVSGYAGGTKETATYRQVSSGRTDHAEVVQITYDPSKITYGQLLRVFFATHDPTTKDRQGPDQGRQYRSAIFYANEDEKRIAAAYIRQLTEAQAFSRPIVTTLEPLEAFYPAEDYHQDFVTQNPLHPYVQQWAVPKVEKVQKQFGDKVRTE